MPTRIVGLTYPLPAQINNFSRMHRTLNPPTSVQFEAPWVGCYQLDNVDNNPPPRIDISQERTDL